VILMGGRTSVMMLLCMSRRAKDLVESNIEILHKTAAVLLEKEQIDGDQFARIIQESQAEQYLKADEPSVTVPYAAAA
jgi:cell division protease FtsH